MAETIVLDAIVSIGVEKLYDLLSKEYKQFQGVEDQVTKLKRELELLSSFLKDADAKKQTSEVVRKVMEQIKDIIYDAEDTIETFVQKEKLRKASGIKDRIKRLACIVPERRKLALEIEVISSRISTVNFEMKKHGVQKNIAKGRHIVQPLQERQKEMRQEFARDHESDFVGLKANVKSLVGYLVEDDDIQIVSVTGMGGLGKTTLARQVFNHEAVKHQFERFAWVCVSQEFTRISVWQSILQSLTSKERKNEILNMKEAELQDELFQLLETSKSLIIFDDIWKEEDWDLIKPIFPPKKGWKVLLTSRTESVAKRGDSTYINFKPECLTVQDSWTLFQRIAMPRKDTPEFNEEMEESAKKMIKHCGGLPLAVKVLGGLLAENYTVRDWNRLSENIGSHVVNGKTTSNNSSIDHVLSMSFEELPSYLKHCFLYLAHFPEDHIIEVEDLSYFWAAEGISKTTHYHGETIRDVADGCIEELVRRNMVIAERDDMTLRFETCRLHDMMREVCLIKAKGENFLHIVGSTSSSSSTADSQSGTSRRLVVQNPTTTSHVDIKNPKLRSLVIVWSDYGKDWMLSGLTLTRLQLMRVLDLSRAKFERGKLPSSIGKLIHLRYFSLFLAAVSHLPDSLRNLKLLIYLNLYTRESSMFVPNVLMGMQELRYLELPWTMHKKTKLELRSLEKLETLKNFSTKNGSIEDLCGMARLRILSITLNDETSLETLSSSISGLKRLENLSITDRYDFIRSEREIEEGIVLDFIHLKQLTLFIQLPRQQRFPSHLTKIQLGGCCLEEDPMPILEKLLQLKEVCISYNSFCGRRMVCSGGGFPQLQKLEIEGLFELEEWIVEEGSMPLLHTLHIARCEKLKELPDGLRFIYSLKKLRINEKWKERLSEGGEDYYKVQHIPSVDFLLRQR